MPHFTTNKSTCIFTQLADSVKKLEQLHNDSVNHYKSEELSKEIKMFASILVDKFTILNDSVKELDKTDEMLNLDRKLTIKLIAEDIAILADKL